MTSWGSALRSFAAGLSGTFVVNGSPTKTEMLDEQKGRTQVANITMSLVALIVVLFLTGLLTNMPKAVLASIVFLIGVNLIDIMGLTNIRAGRFSEFVIATLTACVVFMVGVEQGIILAIVLSILELVRRQYKPKDFVLGIDDQGEPTYQPAAAGAESLPGLLVFRYGAELFYANASRFVDDVQNLVAAAPSPVRWVVLDCSSIDDIDYSAGLNLGGLIDGLHRDGLVFAVAAVDPGLIHTLEAYGLRERFDQARVFPTVAEAVEAFRNDVPATA